MSLPRNGENNPSDTKGISGSDTGSRTAQEVAVDEADAWLFKKSKAKGPYRIAKVIKTGEDSTLVRITGLSLQSSLTLDQSAISPMSEEVTFPWDSADSVGSVTSKLEATSVTSRIERDSEFYDMTHARRGIAVIFNHIHFTNMATRSGTVKDCKNLGEALANLGFEVRVYNDPTLKTISSVLKSVAAENHTDADCLVVAAMSHGESGFLHSNDELYAVDKLWNSFTGDLCPTLAGKPKLFFIQACRGARVDQGVKVIHETDSAVSYSIPAYADIMVAYSTYDGFYSWRNPDAGSWFVQAICKELYENGTSRDLLTIMTFVNRRVALDFQSYVPQNVKMHAKKQIPSVVSMLTRLVYFNKKSNGFPTTKKVTAL